MKNQIMKKIPAGYKQTEIGVIPDDWDCNKVEEMVDVIGGGTPSTTVPKYWNGKIDWFTPTEIGRKKYAYQSKRKLTEEGLKNSSAKILNEGTVLLTSRAGIGDLAILKIKACTNQGFQSLSPHEAIDSEFLYYLMLTKKKELLERASGSTFLEISPNNVRNILIQVPKKQEQTAIATVLSDTDVLIECLGKLIAKKKAIKQGAMQQLLTGKKRLPGFSGNKMVSDKIIKKDYKQTEIGMIPSDWEVRSMNLISDVRDGTHDSPKYVKKGVKFVTSKNIVKGRLDFSDISYISEDDANEVNKRSKVDKKDILMSMIGTIGNAVLIDFEPDFCIKNVALIKPFRERINGNFLIQLLASAIYQNYILRKLEGGIQKFISLSVLRDLDVILPPTLTEQTAIATVLSDMDAEIVSLEKKRDKYIMLKQGMMQQLLTGRRDR